jgi:8-oxo-dGTP pyrophosphatase MutT (NUDIX family)
MARPYQPRSVVAVVLTWRGRIGLFKRSSSVDGGAGMWHCITGYVEDGVEPAEQALAELCEETGLLSEEVLELESCGVLRLLDVDGGTWDVHTFRARTERRRLALNWEHVAYRWVSAKAVPRFDGQVSWLRDVLAAAA